MALFISTRNLNNQTVYEPLQFHYIAWNLQNQLLYNKRMINSADLHETRNVVSSSKCLPDGIVYLQILSNKLFVYESTSGTIKWQVESGQYFIEVTRVEKFKQKVNECSSIQFICSLNFYLKHKKCTLFFLFLQVTFLSI